SVKTPTGKVTFAVLICEEVWDTALVTDAARDGAQVVVVLNSSPYHVGKREAREAQVATAARAAGIPIVYVNGVGGQDEIVFDGQSLVVDADGTVITRMPAFVAGTAVLDIPVRLAAKGGDRDVVDLGATYDTRIPLSAPMVAEP